MNPNAALEFTDKNGESDVVVFEMNRPIYSAKRDTLKFRAKINDGQVLDGALESHSVLADDSFTKKFSESSLFIDNALLRDTQLTTKNNLTENVLLRPITFDMDGKTVANYLYNALGGFVGLGAEAVAVLAGASGPAQEVGLLALAAAEAVGLGQTAVAVVSVELFSSVQEAKLLAEQHRLGYNTYRPHSALQGRTPLEVIQQWKAA